MDLIRNLLLIALLCWLILWLLWTILQRSLLAWQSIEVEGHILERKNVFVPRVGMRYFLTYCYGYNGKDYRRKAKVDEDIYHIWREGDTVKVRCFRPFAFVARLDI